MGNRELIFLLIAAVLVGPISVRGTKQNQEISYKTGNAAITVSTDDSLPDLQPFLIRLIPVASEEHLQKGNNDFFTDTIDYLDSRLILPRKYGSGYASTSDNNGGRVDVIYHFPNDSIVPEELDYLTIYWSYGSSIFNLMEYQKTEETDNLPIFYEARGYRTNEDGDTRYVRMIRIPKHGFTIFYDDIPIEMVPEYDYILNNIQLNEI